MISSENYITVIKIHYFRAQCNSIAKTTNFRSVAGCPLKLKNNNIKVMRILPEIMRVKSNKWNLSKIEQFLHKLVNFERTLK